MTPMTMTRSAARLALALALLLATAAPAAAQTTLKMASLAPGNSTWGQFFKRAMKEVAEKTGGAIETKLYAGGSQGDEKVVVEKMRTGQLHIAAVTAVGLAEIAPEVLVLQAPGLITDYKTLDKVRDQLKERFEEAMRAKGFELLGWGDVGVVYFYSHIPVKAPSDLSKVKMWAWNADPIAREVTKAAGITPVPLGVPDVLPSLNTGHINTFYTSPLACLQLQWCDHVKTRTNYPVAIGIGAVVMEKKAFDGLSAEHQAVVREVWGKWSRALVKKVRVDNDKAVKVLADAKGIMDVSLSAAEVGAWAGIATKVQNALVGSVYPQELLAKVRSIAGK